MCPILMIQKGSKETLLWFLLMEPICLEKIWMQNVIFLKRPGLGPHEGAEDVDRFRTEAAPKLQGEDN